uniref:Plectin/eS10 N-terminal domain-containing protein n=1 Tax=Anopheles minimus TaxID=112268 RepID=A0A182WK90_9DIPT
MHIPKEQRKTIYRQLFTEGVLVAQKTHQPRMHRELGTIPNLHVIQIMKSLVSKQFVKESFCWNHYYWTLTNDGIIYLRDFLHLPAQLVPTTLVNRPRAVLDVKSYPEKDRVIPKPRTDEDRAIYRRPYKQDDAGAGSQQLVFRGGF